jgi:hypothetical protein
MTSPPFPSDIQNNDDGPDTQVVGRLLWAELHENGTQQPTHFEWLESEAAPAATLQSPAEYVPPSSSSPSSSSTPSSSSSTPAPEVSPGFSVPPDLAQWRQRLFQPSEGENITLSQEQWEQFWPYMTNVWTRHKMPYAPKRKKTIRTHWDCRFHKSQPNKTLSTGKRGKQIREGIGCPAKLVEVQDLLSNCREYLVTGSHNHSILELDITKCNNGIQSWVESRLLQGFSPTAIEKVAKGKGKDPSARKNLIDAGGRHLSVQDIRNAAQRLNIRTVRPRHVVGKVPATNQAMEALEWLQIHHEDWHSAFLETIYKGSPSPGLVFARKLTIQTLRERGILALMDSTHHTNKEGW